MDDRSPIKGHLALGLWDKYRITMADGSPVDRGAIYFVLRLDSDPHARVAVKRYAASIQRANPQLAHELRSLITKLDNGEQPAAESDPLAGRVIQTAQGQATLDRLETILADLQQKPPNEGETLTRPPRVDSLRLQQQARGYQHVEAFCRMKYRDGAGNEEWIWNSRDGVTPFIITSRQGLEASHVDWNEDQYCPDYKPQPGERIFVDLTLEKAQAYAARRVEAEWDRGNYPMRDYFDSKEEAIKVLANDSWHEGQAPDLIEVEAVIAQCEPEHSG